jgi:hypothetical protein
MSVQCGADHGVGTVNAGSGLATWRTRGGEAEVSPARKPDPCIGGEGRRKHGTGKRAGSRAKLVQPSGLEERKPGFWGVLVPRCEKGRYDKCLRFHLFMFLSVICVGVLFVRFFSVRPSPFLSASSVLDNKTEVHITHCPTCLPGNQRSGRQEGLRGWRAAL